MSFILARACSGLDYLVCCVWFVVWCGFFSLFRERGELYGVAPAKKWISTRRLTELVVCSGRGLGIHFFTPVARLRGNYVSSWPVRWDWFGYGRGLQPTTADSPRRPSGYRRGLGPTAVRLPWGLWFGSSGQISGKKVPTEEGH